MKRTWQDLVAFGIGAWLVAAPFLLGFFHVESASAIAIWLGAIVGGIAVVGISSPDYWEEWIVLLIGLGLAASPWLAGYSASVMATVNAMGCGLLLVALSALAMAREVHVHHQSPLPLHR